MSGNDTPFAGEGPAATLDGLHETVRREFKTMGGKLDRLLRSSKSIEAGLADPDELKERLSRLSSNTRRQQVLDVLDAVNLHPNWSVAFAAKRLHVPTPHGYPTPEALTTACYRVNILKHRSGPE